MPDGLRSEERSTAGQLLRCNKAAAVEGWQQEVGNKKTFLGSQEGSNSGKVPGAFEMPGVSKTPALVGHTPGGAAAKGGCPCLPEMALMTQFWPMNPTQGLGSDGNSSNLLPKQPHLHSPTNADPKEFPKSSAAPGTFGAAS